jgi:hypothetical protein
MTSSTMIQNLGEAYSDICNLMHVCPETTTNGMYYLTPIPKHV